MRRLLLNTAILAAATLLALGCVAPPQTGGETVPPAGEEAAPPIGGAILVDADSNGESVTLAPGDMLVVDLPSDPNDAESWHVAAMDEGVLAPMSEAELAAVTLLAGAEGTVRTTFRALAAGETTLTLVRAAEFDAGLTPEPDGLFALDITVTE